MRSFRKDFFREITKNKGRFLSVFFIVMLGAAFFSGIRSSRHDMEVSADRYYDETDLMDIRVLGTLGLADEDLRDIRAVDGVKTAEGGHTLEVLHVHNQNEQVVKLTALTEELNRPTIKEGRMMENADECVVDTAFLAESGCKIGDEITFQSGTEEELGESLDRETFTIVSTADLPYYMDLDRGTGSIGDGSIDSFVILMPEVFTSDIYTEMYVQAEGTKELASYGSEYEEAVDAILERVEAIADAACERRYESVYREASEEIEDAKEEVADAERELADAADEIADGEEKIADAKITLTDSEQELKDGAVTLAEKEQELDDAKKTIAEKEQELADGKKTLAEKEQEFRDSKALVAQKEAELIAGKEELAAKTKDLEDGKQKIAAKTAELESAKQELEAQAAYLAAGKKELETKEAVLAEGKEELETKAAVLAEKKEELEAKAAEVAEGKAQLEVQAASLAEGRAQLEAAKTELEAKSAELAGQEESYLEAKEGLKNVNSGILEVEGVLAQLEAQLEAMDPEDPETADLYEQLMQQKTAAEEQKEQLYAQKSALQEGIQAYESGVQARENARRELAEQEQMLAEGERQLEEGRAQLAEGERQIEEGRVQLAEGERQIEEGRAQLAEGELQIEEGRAQIAAGENQLISYRAQLADGESQLKSYQAQITDGENQLAAAAKVLRDGEQQINDAKVQLADGEKQLMDGRRELADGERQLADGRRELADGESQLADARQTLLDGQMSLDDAKKELADKELELLDAKAEYEDALAEAGPKLADAREKIADGEKELAKLEIPEWYVWGRDKISSASGFGDDAERIANIGKVFPVIFFLVAALVSLTTMTRMVEEQRQQIGTLKALGYSDGAIAMKYFAYAMLATVFGALIGVIFGEKLLPWVIMNAYGMLYTGLPYYLTPLNWDQGILAILASAACTGVATLAACGKELRAKPAALMRPEPPKNGKRVFLERIGVIWHHLNFTQKSTVRNLVRYKKRFFMTVIGIGGCMGLIVVGFGLQDSIKAIAKNQFIELFTYQANAVLEPGADNEEREEFLRQVLEYPGMGKTQTMYVQNIDLETDKRTMGAVLEVPETTEFFEDFYDFRDRITKEHYMFPTDGAAISEKTAKMLGVSVGDTVRMKKGDEAFVEVPISCIIENYVQHYIFISSEFYQKLYGEMPEYNQLLLRYEDTSKENEKKMGQMVMECEGVAGISFTTDLEQNIDDMLRSLDIVMIVLILSAGLLAFVVIYNLNNINITERKRELATLKVLGFYDGEVSAYVYRENIILTLIGIVAGMGIGAFLHQYVIQTVEVDAMMFGRLISLRSYFVSALLTVVFACVVNLMMYYRLKKIDMIESLKSVE